MSHNLVRPILIVNMNTSPANIFLALVILLLQSQVFGAQLAFGFGDVPSFETTTGVLHSTRCVLVLTDEHPTPYASGQKRYILEFVMDQNNAFQLLHAETGSIYNSCSGHFDTRTNQYKTTVYYGANLYKQAKSQEGLILENFLFFDNNAVLGTVELVLELKGQSTFTITDHNFVRDYMSEAVYINADDAKNIALPSSIDLNNLVVTLNSTHSEAFQEELTSPSFVSTNEQGLVLMPMSADVGYYNLRLNWNKEVEYLTVVVSENPSKLEAEADAIDIAEFNSANVQAIPVRVITYNPSSFSGNSEFQRAETASYGPNTWYQYLNAQYKMGIDETNFFELCGELPSDYDKATEYGKGLGFFIRKNVSALGHTSCMINEVMRAVNSFGHFTDLGIKFAVDEIVHTDYAGFDMTRDTYELLDMLSTSSLAKSGYINIFYVPYVATTQGVTYLNSDINGPNGASIVRVAQLDLNYDASITAHEIGHVFGVSHLIQPSIYRPKSNPDAELQVPSFLDIGANPGCTYLNVMSSFGAGCDDIKNGFRPFNSLVHGKLIKTIFARQLYEWRLTDQKVTLQSPR